MVLEWTSFSVRETLVVDVLECKALLYFVVSFFIVSLQTLKSLLMCIPSKAGGKQGDRLKLIGITSELLGTLKLHDFS